METSVITIDQAMHDQKISSIEIASLIGKPHNDLMKAIRKMEPAWEQEHLGKFSQMQIQESLPNGGYRLRQDRAFHYYGLNGEKKQRLYLVWTPEGADFLQKKLNIKK